MLKFVVCLGKRCVGCCVSCLYDVRRGVVRARVWEVCVFRHADGICLCLMCIMWQFSMLHSA